MKNILPNQLAMLANVGKPNASDIFAINKQNNLSDDVLTMCFC